MKQRWSQIQILMGSNLSVICACAVAFWPSLSISKDFLSSPSTPSTRLKPLHRTYRLRALPSSRTARILTLEGSLDLLRCYLIAPRNSYSVFVNESLMGGHDCHQQHQTESQSELTAGERTKALWLHVVTRREVWEVFFPFLLLQDGGWGGGGPGSVLTQAHLWRGGGRG